MKGPTTMLSSPTRIDEGDRDDTAAHHRGVVIGTRNLHSVKTLTLLAVSRSFGFEFCVQLQRDSGDTIELRPQRSG